MAYLWNRELVELLLVRDGFGLRDIRGETEIHTITEPATDMWASLGRLTPRSVRLGIAAAMGLGLLLSVETGYVGPTAVSIVVALVFYAIGELDEPGPVTKTHKVERRGLSEREVTDYLTMSNTLKEMRDEEIEDAREEAERRNRGGM